MSDEQHPAILAPDFLLRDHRRDLEGAIAGRAVLIGEDAVDDGGDTPKGPEVIVSGMEHAVFDRAIAAPTVRWVHSISAGVEHLPLGLIAERGILLTNSAGAYATAMAEYVIGAAITKKFVQIFAAHPLAASRALKERVADALDGTRTWPVYVTDAGRPVDLPGTEDPLRFA